MKFTKRKMNGPKKPRPGKFKFNTIGQRKEKKGQPYLFELKRREKKKTTIPGPPEKKGGWRPPLVNGTSVIDKKEDSERYQCRTHYLIEKAFSGSIVSQKKRKRGGGGEGETATNDLSPLVTRQQRH